VSSITIVVPTKDRLHLLKDCLLSIRAARLPKQHELIVIDSSNPSYAKKVEKMTKNCKGRYIYEEKRGAPYARNRAIIESENDIVAFVGDDCIVEKNWAVQLLKNYRLPSVACVTGRILSSRTLQGSSLERFSSHDRGATKRTWSVDATRLNILPLLRLGMSRRALKELAPFPWSFGSTDNASFRRCVFETTGFFDTQNITEDIDMFIRIFLTGFRLIYEPKAIVYHSYVQTFEETAKKLYQYGLTDGTLMLKYARKPYFLVLFVGCLINSIYRIGETLLTSDKSSCYLQTCFVQGLCRSLHVRPLRGQD